MDTDRLRYFCVIFETGSLTKAAEILNISHSALSKSMTVLQDELGLVLFRNVGRGIEATEAATEVYHKSKDIVAKVAKLRQSEVATVKNLRIGISELLGLCFSRTIVDAISPETCFLFNSSTGELELNLIEKKIDFGLCLVPFPQKNIEYLKLAKLVFGVYKLKDLFRAMPSAEIPFVVPTSNVKENPLNLRTSDGWPAQIERNIHYGATSVSSGLEIVNAGKACIFIPKVLAFNINRTRAKNFLLEEIESPLKPVTFDLLLVKHSHTEENQIIKRISKEIRLLCSASL